MAAVKIIKIIVTLLSLHTVIVGTNSLYDLFRSPSSFFKIRQRRTNSPPLRFSSSRTQARILNKDISAPAGQLRQTSSRRSDQYMEEPSTFFPSKPISFEPNFMQISEENSDEKETRKLSNPLQFKSIINSDRTGEITPSGSLESNIWNSPEIVESSPERFTFWPQNKINYGELEKNKVVYAEERISLDDGVSVDDIEESEGEEIQAATTIADPQSSLNNVNVPDIKTEPIQLTPSLSPLEPQEAKVSRTSSIDNIEKFFGQLANKKNGEEKPVNNDLKHEENISILLSTEATTSNPPSSVTATTTPEPVSENISEESLKIENFFGQLADASSSSKERSSGSNRNDIEISKDLISQTKTGDNDNGTPTNSPIIVDLVDIKTENNDDDDHGLDNKTEINLGVTKQNISKTPESDITIIVDTEDEIANKSYQHQTLEIIDHLSLNLSDHNQASPESEIYVGKLEKPGEKSDLEEEKEEIISTIKELSEETTTFTIVDKTQETRLETSSVGNTDVSEETEGNSDEPTTARPEVTTTRRLPSRYVNSKTRSRPKVTTKPPAKVINHNMNLQTALIINTLSKVLPNVPQSRLKNQPRLETVGLGVKFHQEELFIFHSTLTELHAILEKSLARGGLPSDLMVSIFAAKEHTITLVHLFYKLLLEAELAPDKTLTISKEDSRIFAKHFHFLRAIFPFL